MLLGRQANSAKTALAMRSSNSGNMANYSVTSLATGWRTLIGSPKLQVIFRKRATNYRALLWKVTYEDKGSYESSLFPIPPPPQNSTQHILTHTHTHQYTRILTNAHLNLLIFPNVHWRNHAHQHTVLHTITECYVLEAFFF